MSPINMNNLLHELVPRGDDHGHSRGQRALVVTAVLTSLAGLVVAMRVYARVRLMKSTGREDWAIIIAMVCHYTSKNFRPFNNDNFLLFRCSQSSIADLLVLVCYHSSS